MTTPTREPKRSDMIDRIEAAKILDCHPKVVDRLGREGILTRYRLVGDARIFYDRVAVEACLEPIPVETS